MRTNNENNNEINNEENNENNYENIYEIKEDEHKWTFVMSGRVMELLNMKSVKLWNDVQNDIKGSILNGKKTHFADNYSIF